LLSEARWSAKLNSSTSWSGANSGPDANQEDSMSTTYDLLTAPVSGSVGQLAASRSIRARALHTRGVRREAVKRLVDLSLALLGSIVALPLLAVIGLAIKLTDGGPVLFKQTRVGRGGRLFTMYKLRTMVVDAEQRLAALATSNESAAHLFKMKHDPRVTPLGRVLRRLSLDELPQLLNVLNGTMSLVGPRPHLAAEVARLPQEAQRRSTVKPGLTGLWQISGRSNLGADEAVRLDIRYVDTWSLKLDLLILLGTVPAVLTARGAH
jgi:lipopolysaccharide/colanic/teichoic acid biosynthesis glycosyltransferase